MNSLHSIKHNKSEFDWDDINVGDFNLDHSENFFVQNPAILAEDSASTNYKDGDTNRKNSLRQSNHVPQEIISDHSPIPADCASVPVSQSNDGQSQNTFCIQQGEEKANSTNLIDEDKRNGSSKSPSNLVCDKKLNDGNFKTKLKLEWTPPSKVSKMENAFDDVSVGAVPPRAYAYKDIYQNKREMAVRQREEEERKARQFQSRPVPNFKALHRRLEDVIVVHRITVPVTPETVKHSFADKERRKQKEEQQKLEIDRKSLQEISPFHLRADQRVRDRQKYNAIMQLNMEQKQLKLDEQRKKQELDENKEIRKLTEFRARPNPFK